MPRELTPEQARRISDPSLFECDTTEEMVPAAGIIGQDRALSALKFGLNISKEGFNVFVSGPTGTGRTTAIKSFLEELATKKSVPSDWCYVHNFRDSYYPKALQLPAGMGRDFQKDISHAIENARKNLIQAFASKEYSDRRSEITEEHNRRREQVFNDLSKMAKEKGLVLQPTSLGLVLAPAGKEGPMSEEEYELLGEEKKERIKKSREELTRKLKDQITKLRSEESELEKRLEETDREVARFAINHLFDKLREKYNTLAQVLEYLKEIESDIVENYAQFKVEEKPSGADPTLMMQEMFRKQAVRKYDVNLLVDNSELKGAPVIVELNPTFNNLFGLIEKEAQFGALSTDFTMIKAGSLHRANGGFLVLRLEDLLTNPMSWEVLKRTLRDGKLNIEDIGERFGFIATKSLRPEPIPLDTKVVIIGEPMYYYMLYSYDPEFKELFKVKADFDTRMDYTPDNVKSHATVICRVCKEENLKHLDRGALAKMMEHSSRLAGDQEKLSTLFADIADSIREANFWAESDDTKYIEAKHVQKAIEQKIYRSNLLQQRINEMIARGMIFIDTASEEVGQVNGLAVLSLGDFAFGKPSRITATLGVGREGLIDIEREAKLGGPLHSKGVMILSGYLTDKYTKDIPLSLSARLVFEQSYEGVEGDSASSTELYSLISCIADVPIKQGIAVTGSVNQKGEVQPIGGVNEKVEGYFEVCRAKNCLDGYQGVIIPESNVKNLMLKEEVVKTIKEGKFHIYPVSSIDEGIEVLTGMKAGKRLEDGSFEADSINDRVQKRMISLAERLRDFAKGDEQAKVTKDKDKEN